MRRFKWIDWNLDKVNAHGLSADDVEGAFENVFALQPRDDASFQMLAKAPMGRMIWVIWRYDGEGDVAPDIFVDLDDAAIFVITAY